jgi:NAD(P)-dependent dehydrogenase (short-subunit alcohol dehydrogenase family)
VAKLALVTGGHRRVGAVIAAHLARAGYALALHGSHDAEPEAGLAAVLAETGAEWRGFTADFGTEGQVEGLIPSVTEAFGRAPDLLVNSASIFGQDTLADTDAAALAQHFAVNCVAPSLLMQAFAAAKGGEGRSIVNILDQRIDNPTPDQFAYTLSKVALAGATRVAARTLAPAIRVNGVAPGLTLVTPDYSQAQIDALEQRMPLRHLPSPDAIAEAVLFLAQAKSVTGQVIYADAGAHLESYARDFVYLDR